MKISSCRKYLSPLLLLIMITVLTACSSSGGSSVAGSSGAGNNGAGGLENAATGTSPAAGAAGTGDVIQIKYYCSEEGCLASLQEAINEWNASSGAEKGISILLISNINAYRADLEVLMEAGTHYDLVENGDNTAWYLKGWVLDLTECGNPQIDALIESARPYFTDGINTRGEEVVCIPASASPVRLAVNKDLFEKNGLSCPATWDDVMHCARVITENGNGQEFGFGWSTWTEAWQHYCFELCVNSTGSGWWNPKADAYDFSVFKKPAECIRSMCEQGWVLGADDLNHDAVCSQFAEGKIGMFPVSSYSILTERFPAKCSWEFIAAPAFEADGAPYPGVYLVKQGPGIDKISYEAADGPKKTAMEEAWLFLNSDELLERLYQRQGLIPIKEELRRSGSAEGARDGKTADGSSPDGGSAADHSLWAQYSDLSGLRPMDPNPDTLIPLEGAPMHEVLTDFLHGTIDYDTAAADLNTRYNAAYREISEE